MCVLLYNEMLGDFSSHPSIVDSRYKGHQVTVVRVSAFINKS